MFFRIQTLLLCPALCFFLLGCSSTTSPSADLIASEAMKLGGAAVGIIAAQQIYEATKEGDSRKIAEAYEQGKREARTEASNAYWRSVTGADGSEYYAAQNEGKKLKFRQIQYDPHVSQGAIYGASYAPEDMTIRGQ